MNIAIQGAEGSFHHQVALHMQADADMIFCTDFKAVFQTVTNGSADYGLSAIENSLHGSINEVYRLLERYNTWIVKDTNQPIDLYLISHDNTSLDDLINSEKTKVLSQAPALAQVELWLDEHLPKATRIEANDTALSVAEVMKGRDKFSVAVASKQAAAVYGGKILAEHIQDNHQNSTRFILFQKSKPVPSANNTQASIILKTSHQPGALLQALNVFAEHQSNLTKLNSHPIPGDQRHYAFYIDYDLPTGVTNQQLIDQLTSLGCQVKLLGEYFTVPGV